MTQNDAAFAVARKQYYTEKEVCFQKAIKEAAAAKAFEKVESLCNEYGAFLESHQDAFA